MSKPVSFVVILLALIAFGGLASAQTHITDCNPDYTFTAGSGNFDMSFCVNDYGSILQYATPTSSEHFFSSEDEGLGFCDNTGGANGNPTQYYDYAAGGLLHFDDTVSPTVTQKGGPNTLPLTISRLTTDGLWNVETTFTDNAKDRSVKIQMVLANLTGISRSVSILRFADIDANASTDNDFEATLYSSTAANQGQVGIQLRDWANVADVPMVFTVSKPAKPNPCSLSPSTVPFSGDGAIGLQYNRTVPAGKSKTVSVQYRPY